MVPLSDVPADLLKNLGASGIVLLVVVMILTDRIVTRRRLDDMIADRDKWREAFKASEEARQTQLAQTHAVVVELGQTVDKFTRELQTLAHARLRGAR